MSLKCLKVHPKLNLFNMIKYLYGVVSINNDIF